MWQTPLSMVSARNSTPFASSSSRAASTSSTCSAIGMRVRLELDPEGVGLHDRDRE